MPQLTNYHNNIDFTNQGLDNGNNIFSQINKYEKKQQIIRLQRVKYTTITNAKIKVKKLDKRQISCKKTQYIE